MKILLACEPSQQGLDPVGLELIAAARHLAHPADEIVALIVADPETARTTLGAADRVICVPGPLDTAFTPETAQTILLDIVTAENPDLVLVAYSALGLDLAPWLAGRSKMGMVAYVNGLERNGDTITARSQLYGGKLQARTDLALPCVLSITPGAFDPVETKQATNLETRDVPLPAKPRMRLTSVELPDLSALDLTKSEKILCVGRGISDENGVAQARDLAARIGADLAGSRPVIDSGMLDKLHQVGKSGQKVKPEFYIALGVSGAPEHLEGIGAAKTIIAINTDPDAPIFNVAHYTATCDLFEFMEALTDLLPDQPMPKTGAA